MMSADERRAYLVSFLRGCAAAADEKQLGVDLGRLMVNGELMREAADLLEVVDEPSTGDVYSGRSRTDEDVVAHDTPPPVIARLSIDEDLRRVVRVPPVQEDAARRWASQVILPDDHAVVVEEPRGLLYATVVATQMHDVMFLPGESLYESMERENGPYAFGGCFGMDLTLADGRVLGVKAHPDKDGMIVWGLVGPDVEPKRTSMLTMQADTIVTWLRGYSSQDEGLDAHARYLADKVEEIFINTDKSEERA